jgi:hypothetical protein
MLAVDTPSIALGESVAAGLRCRGVATEVKPFSGGVPMHPLTADLVIVGLGLVPGEVVGSRAARSWLASIVPEVPGQLAAAFNVRTGWAVAPGQLTAGGACRVMSASGFRLADLPMTFRTLDEVQEGSDREFARAEDWGRALADTLQLFLISAISPVVSGQGH